MIRPGERGAALLSVLLLVAVMATLAALSLDRLRLATRLAGAVGAADQARAYALAGEQLVLRRAADLRGQRSGAWAGRAVPLPLPGGGAVVRLSDGGNCFNLNALVAEDAPGVLTARPVAIAQFAELLRLIGVEQGQAAGLAAATADWIDSDTAPLPLGAEDDAYRGASPVRLTAGQRLVDVREWRQVRGVTAAIDRLAAPWLCALPTSDPAAINVNSLAPARAALLAMLLPGELTPGAARAALAARPADGFGSALRFWQSAALAGLDPPPDVAQQVTVNARWVAAELDVNINDSSARSRVLIDLGSGAGGAGAGDAARVVRRRWGWEG